jgi:mono/diheme cytochrome c family protein
MNRIPRTVAAGIFATLTLAAGAAAQQPAAAPAPAPDGAALYTRLCSNCHGVTGTPPEAMKRLFPAIVVLSDSTFLASLTADSIVVVLQGVGTGKHKKPFTDRMSHEEMVAVAAFVKSLGTAHGP